MNEPPISKQYIACCTHNSILHLFEDPMQFVQFCRANSAGMGLVMAWINGVQEHPAWMPPVCRICGEKTMHMGDLCYSCGQKNPSTGVHAVPPRPD